MVNYYFVLSELSLKNHNGQPLFSKEFYQIFENHTMYQKDNIYHVFINHTKYIIKYAKKNQNNQLVFEKENQDDKIYNNLIHCFYESYTNRKIICNYYYFSVRTPTILRSPSMKINICLEL